jgi:hypothetical protein
VASFAPWLRSLDYDEIRTEQAHRDADAALFSYIADHDVNRALEAERRYA